nr:hypothetical protein GCM10023233_26330 [Brevibacterium otitidis]
MRIILTKDASRLLQEPPSGSAHFCSVPEAPRPFPRRRNRSRGGATVPDASRPFPRRLSRSRCDSPRPAAQVRAVSVRRETSGGQAKRTGANGEKPSPPETFTVIPA